MEAQHGAARLRRIPEADSVELPMFEQFRLPTPLIYVTWNGGATK